MPPEARYSVPPLSLPRASDGILAMLISLAALVFVVQFVFPLSDTLASGDHLQRLGASLLVAAVLIERAVELGLRRRWAAQGRSRDEVQRAAFLVVGLAGLLVALAGVRTLTGMLEAEALAALTPARRALLVWTDLVITTGLIAGLADAFHKLVHAGRVLLHRAPAA